MKTKKEQSLLTVKALAKLNGKDVLPSVKLPVKRKPRAKETKPREKVEMNLQSMVFSDLRILELNKKIAWFDRLNSGKVIHHGRFIQLCRKGTSDAIVFCFNKKVVFIEFKGTGTQTEDQKKFESKIKSAGHIYIVIKSYEEYQQYKKDGLFYENK